MPLQKAPENWILPTVPALQGVDDPVIAQLAATRGLSLHEVQSLIAGRPIDHDPFTMRGMDAAVTTIQKALHEKRQIIVYGDFDTDGVTAMTTLIEAFRTIGIEVTQYIPERVDGYGIHAEPIAEFGKKYPTSCLISVDCGVSSDAEAKDRPNTMLMVVTDHHLPRRDNGVEVIAPADAVINPKQELDSYPFDGLSGSGVAYKLVQALEKRGVFPPGTADSVVGYAALGTIADMMPLVDENRSLVLKGLKPIREGKLRGVRALLRRVSVSSTMTALSLARGFIPKVNSAGRIGDASPALKLFTAQTDAEAEEAADELMGLDQKRKNLVDVASQQAIPVVEKLPRTTKVVVLNTDDLPISSDPEARKLMPGVVGLIANKVAELFSVTVFVVAGEMLRGSGRTRDAVNVKVALEDVAETLDHYGGHAGAAGFTIIPGKLEAFKRAITKAVLKQLDPNVPRRRDLVIDAVVRGSDLDRYLPQRLKILEPYGSGNPEPLLAVLDVRVTEARRFGKTNDAHIAMRIETRDGVTLDVISWNDPRGTAKLVDSHIDLCGTFHVKEYRRTGAQYLEMVATAIRPAREIRKPDVSLGAA